VVRGERVFRLVRPHAAAFFADLLHRDVVRDLVRRGALIGTRTVECDTLPADLRECSEHLFEHERVPFVSHPAEWSPSMLADAAGRTVELARELLPHGLILKDATPSNVQYRGADAVFVDVPSIVRREPGTFLWTAQQQFMACFLLPLIANSVAGVPLRWLLQDTYSGISQEQVARMLGLGAWLRPRLLRLVALPASLGRRSATASRAARAMVLGNDRQACFILERQFRGLERDVSCFRRAAGRHASHWRDYADSRSHYSPADLEAKRGFVARAVAAAAPAWTLDVGCNTGEFSEMAAAHGRVVAIDSDENSVSAMFDRVQGRRLPILPLVVDLADPTPARGWCNGESASFLERAVGRFDLVMLLAVVHHLRVSAGIPLLQVIDLVARLCRRHAIIEWVPATDPMFAQIARGREALYEDYDRARFEALLLRHFSVEAQQALGNGRVLYALNRSGGAGC
jgi:SAM-dependent methyltransferase